MRSPAGSSRGSLAITAGAVLALFAVLALVAVSRGGDDGLRITEIVSSQAHGFTDGYGAHPDWIEIHNPTDDTVSLEGWGLADRDDPSDPWRFPQVSMEPDEYLVVLASGRDGHDPDGHLHTDFRLDRDGESVALIDPDGDVVDRVPPVRLDRNHSLGRHPHDSTRWCRFLLPTPAAPNGPVCWDDERMGAPELSSPSGFYDDPIEVTLAPTGGADEIWYTLDGSYPDLDLNPDSTLVYDGPIGIEDRSSQPNHLSGISVSLDPDLVDSAIPTHIPEDPVPKGTVLRARSPHGADVSASYFVGEQHRRDALPVLSLSLDEGYLFDEETGLFMPGETFEQFLHGPAFHPGRGWGTPANWTQSGRDWERPLPQDSHRRAWMHWCEPDQGCVYEAPLGVRVHGGASRWFNRKSLRLYARTDYGSRPFTHPFFEELGPTHHHRLILRNGGNNQGRSLIADGYLQSLMTHFEADTQAFRPSVLYLNGEYWGIYNLRERYDQHYLEVMHGADPDTVVILDFTRMGVETGDPSGLDAYLALLDNLARATPQSSQARERIEAAMDVDSFFDFVIAHVFAGNRDWAGNNARAWRQPNGDGDGTTLDGRWRWLIIDLDLAGQGEFDSTYDALRHRLPATDNPYGAGGIAFLFNRVTSDRIYRDRFLNRFADHLNTTFLPERTVADLDELEASIESEIPNHVARWGEPRTVDSWHAHIEHIRDFMYERPAIQWQQLLDRFDLPGTERITVRSDPDHGYVRLNSLHLREGTPGVFDPHDWSGDYFLGVPIQFEAVPADGYRFVRWEGVPVEMAETRQLTREVTGPMALRAVFEPIADSD